MTPRFLSQGAARILAASLVAGQFLAAQAAVVATGPQVREFLGGRTGKIAYLKNLGQVYFVDLQDSLLVERRVSADNYCLSPQISPDGSKVLYEHSSSIWIRDLVENSQTRIQVHTRPWLVGQTMEPHWWVDPRDSAHYVIYSTGIIHDHEWTPAMGSTYMVKLDKAFKPVGTTMLLPFMMTGGRSKDGAWGATSGHSTGMYSLNPAKVENAFRSATNWLTEGVLLGCQPSISPSPDPARQNRMLHLHSGGYTIHGKVYDNHKAILLRSWTDPDVHRPLWWMGPLGDRCENDSSGNLFWDAVEWSNDENYFTATGSKEVDIPEGKGDLYAVRMNLAGGDSRLIRIFQGGGTDYYSHLWIKNGISPARIRLEKNVLEFAAYKKDTVNPAAKVMAVANAGDGTLPALQIGRLPPWLKVAVTGNGTNAPTLVTSVSRDSLEPGTHRAVVPVTYGNGADSAAYEVVFRYSDPVLTSLRARSSHPVVAVGDSIRLEAAALDQTGSPLSVQPAIVWSGTGSLKPDASGLFLADTVPWRTYQAIAASGAVACTVYVTVAREILRIDVGSPAGGPAPGWIRDSAIHGGLAGTVPAGTALAWVADGAPEAAARTFRQGSVGFLFRNLPNGRYNVRFHLVAPQAGSAGTAALKLEGAKLLEGLAVPAASDSLARPSIMRELPVSVADGNGLAVEVLAGADAPALSALEIYDIGRPPISLLSPNGQEALRVGDTLTVQWKADSVITSCGVSLSVDSGVKWLPLTRRRSVGLGDPDWERFQWVIPDSLDGISLISARAMVSVYDYFGTDRDRSDSVFTIAGAAVSTRAGGRREARAPAYLGGGLIRIDLELWPGTCRAEFSDLSGRMVRTQVLHGGRQHLLALDGLPPAVYRLTLVGPGRAQSLLVPVWP